MKSNWSMKLWDNFAPFTCVLKNSSRKIPKNPRRSLLIWIFIWKNYLKVCGGTVCYLKCLYLLKKRLWHRCFPVNFVKFLRTPCIREHTWWLLLTVKNYSKSKSKNQSKTLRKKCPYSKLFWSAFFPHFPALGLNTGITPYSARMPENAGKMRTRTTSNTDTFYAVKSFIWKSIQ